MTKSPELSIQPVDYDRVQFDVYAKGRALPPSTLRLYMAVFGLHLPERRPLTGIDLGSGTGRFTPSLADAFGGPVYGVEPAVGMRRQAEADARHHSVRYLPGDAAAIPLPDASADFVLMFMSFHHVPDRAAAAREIARVLKPGGRLILRSTFRDRVPDNWWRSYFPRSAAVEDVMFPSVAETRAIFETEGFSTSGVEQIEIPFESDPGTAVAKLQMRAVSTFEHMSEVELDEGFAQLEAALAAGTLEPKPTPGDLIVFARS